MQFYDTDVNKEYAIRGNSAVLKCVVPSFVADFVTVLSWHTDQGEEFVRQDTEMGTILNNASHFFQIRLSDLTDDQFFFNYQRENN